MNSTVKEHPNEVEIVAQALDDLDHFGPLYDFYAARVFTYVRYRAETTQEAEDLTARIFSDALENLKNFRSEQGAFGAWLFGIAYNVISRYYRKQKRFLWLPLDSVANHHDESEDPPEKVVIRNENHQALLNAVQQLPERERNLIALKFAGELNNRQIAEITGLTESNVGTILYRTIKHLRSMLVRSEGMNHHE